MKIETPILKRLGPVPFWRGERRCLDSLEDIYRRAAEAARKIVGDIRPSILLCACAFVTFGGAAGAATGDVLRASWFSADITPPVGTLLAGYGPQDVSLKVADELYATGLAFECEGRRAIIVAFDLLGIDAPVLREFRRGVAKRLGTDEAYVLLTCTHTHGGPHTRTPSGIQPRSREFTLDGNPPPGLDAEYLKTVRMKLYSAVETLASGGKWHDVRVGCFSSQVEANSNRRYTTADNCASFTAHRRVLKKIATGIADCELGTIVLLDAATSMPLYVIGNYAAHPLASHAPGTGGLCITSDFPGFYRRYLKAECGAEAMFVQGAAGDLIPNDDELGTNAARRLGERLAEESMAAIIDIQRNAERFVLPSPRLGAEICSMEAPVLERQSKRCSDPKLRLDVQCFAIGDVAFVGVPGEPVCEVGLEIKWNSPFRRTFVAYCATDYVDYISPANLVAAGGYEAKYQLFPSRDTLRMVCLAANTLSEVREIVFPGQACRGADRYPDYLQLPLVNLPGGFKAAKTSK